MEDDDDHVPASRRTTGRLAALRARHSRSWGPEDLSERLQASDQIVALAQATDDGDLAMEGYAWRIVDRLEMGRLSQADEDIASFSALASAIGDPLYRRDAASYSVMRAMLEGRFDDARTAMLDGPPSPSGQATPRSPRAIGTRSTGWRWSGDRTRPSPKSRRPSRPSPSDGRGRRRLPSSWPGPAATTTPRSGWAACPSTPSPPAPSTPSGCR